MRLLPFGVASAEENLSLDGKLFFDLEEGEGEPAFRLYRWSELALSLGYHQKPLPLPLRQVRRPTGGGALLHRWDVSFALVDRRRESPLRTYARFTALLKELLKKLGLELFSCPEGKRSELCYFYSTKGELCTREGKKAVAVAMRSGRRAFLLHGSFYFHFPYREASRLLRVPERRLRRNLLSLEEAGIREEDLTEALYSFPSVWLRRA